MRRRVKSKNCMISPNGTTQKTKKVGYKFSLFLVVVDEWGAVIKNQSEAFTRMEDDRKRQQADMMQSYGKELESEVFNKLRKNKDSEMDQKKTELEQALHKKAELDMMNHSNLEKKKYIQNVLAQEYEDAIRRKQQRNQYDKITDLQNGRMAIDKAQKELNYLNQNENEKRKMIKEILNNAKNIHDGVRTQTEKDRYVATLEQKKHLEEMERRQRDQDMAKISRYNKFNEFQNKNARAYADKVINPLMEKEMKFHQSLRKQEMEAKRKAELDAESREKMKKNMAMQTRFGQEKQMKDRNDGTQATVAEHRYDEFNTRAIERDLNNLKNQDFTEKKIRQLKYKEMLDNQKKTKDYMKMYGNMTGIEKQMNKNDLSAFKNYETKTYALIPGLNSTSMAPSKKVIEDKFQKKRERSYDEEVDRMNRFGLTRDVTLIKNPALYTANAHRSSMNDITGHVPKPNYEQNFKSARAGSQAINRDIIGHSPVAITTKMPGQNTNMTVNNFNNHHLYQSYNPISGQYSPEKQAMNQARTTFRFAGNNIMK
jgi:hypothetical protein